MPAPTDIAFHGLKSVPNPSSSQGNSSPLEKGWFTLLTTILRFNVEAVRILQAIDKTRGIECVKFKECTRQILPCIVVLVGSAKSGISRR